ncbi:hypothetical protein EZL74_10120 [Flavobacterium silvisoli]|uniref:Uncharacterized protein n=1 Tax=Flavobacterium silvisoli TaxID=2529433 RepID=A0A4Q9YW53_9FLAO|nr:hypothetical protein [Flavobacterium silvisoli]TBX67006.1 hypothetical protein EZL74_10120 [Flavobacterium silvisoli]
MKHTLSLRYLLCLFLLVVFYNCSPIEQFRYEKRQSVLIGSLRERLFFEYSSPLNDSMKIYMELELAKNPELQLPLEKIYSIEEKLKKEKPLLGCYYLMKKEFDGEKKLYIILDWNQNSGVIIRFFTDSPTLIKSLPDYSF